MVYIVLIIMSCSKISTIKNKGMASSKMSHIQASTFIDKNEDLISKSDEKKRSVDKKICDVINNNYKKKDAHFCINILLLNCLLNGLLESSYLILSKYTDTAKMNEFKHRYDKSGINYMKLAAGLDIKLLHFMLANDFDVNILYKQSRPWDEKSSYKKMYGKNIEEVEKGSNLLMFAARENKLDVAKLVLDYNIDMNQRDEFNKTAFDIAIENNHLNIAKEIISRKVLDFNKFKFNWMNLLSNEDSKYIELSEYFIKELISLYQARIKKLEQNKDLNDIEVKRWIVIGKTCLFSINRFNSELVKKLYKELIKVILKHNSISYKLITNEGSKEYIDSLDQASKMMELLPIEIINLIMNTKV